MIQTGCWATLLRERLKKYVPSCVVVINQVGVIMIHLYEGYHVRPIPVKLKATRIIIGQ